jgi:hypothetical protein
LAILALSADEDNLGTVPTKSATPMTVFEPFLIRPEQRLVCADSGHSNAGGLTGQIDPNPTFMTAPPGERLRRKADDRIRATARQ